MKRLIGTERYICSKGAILVNTYEVAKTGEGKYNQRVNYTGWTSEIFVNGDGLCSTSGFLRKKNTPASIVQQREKSIIDIVENW